jgi:hypothetical protein
MWKVFAFVTGLLVVCLCWQFVELLDAATDLMRAMADYYGRR